MRSTALPIVLAAGLLLGYAPGAAAQVPTPLLPPDSPHAVAGDEPAFAPLRPRPLPVVLLPGSDPRRLPVLDDAGRPITLAEIESRVDRGGGWGMIGGAAGGALIGGLIAALLTESVPCGTANGVFGPYDLCSPQEEALRSTLGWTGFLLVFGSGMALGWHADVVTWQEAVTRIRMERASAGAAQ